jgi:hypothetical protein
MPQLHPSRLFSIVLATLLWSLSIAEAQVPQRMHYQGYLTLANGDPVECADPATCSAPVDLTFRIYSDANADALLWEEDHLEVIVVGGVFNVTRTTQSTSAGGEIFTNAQSCQLLGISPTTCSASGHPFLDQPPSTCCATNVVGDAPNGKPTCFPQQTCATTPIVEIGCF